MSAVDPRDEIIVKVRDLLQRSNQVPDGVAVQASTRASHIIVFQYKATLYPIDWAFFGLLETNVILELVLQRIGAWVTSKTLEEVEHG
jgi:hypothetical protein